MKESINNYTEDNESIKNSDKSIFPQEEWEHTFWNMCDEFFIGNSSDLKVKSHPNKVYDFIKTEIRKAEENTKTNLLREMKQMADKEVKISMVAGEIIQVRQLEVIQTVAKLHNIRL